MKPKLYNRKTGAPADAVYIGRGSAWGNPFPIGPAPHACHGEVLLEIANAESQ